MVLQYFPGAIPVIISVVIVNWNSGALLERCVGSLRENAPDCEVLVIDNASEDESCAFLVGSFPWARLLRNRENRGFAGGCNQGWRESAGNLVLFLNPDAEALSGSVQQLVMCLTRREDAWAAGGCLVSSSNRANEEYRSRAFPTVASVCADMLFLDEIWPGNPWTGRHRSSGPGQNQLSEVDQPAGACLMIRREVLESLEGFDERFIPAWFEDVDLCKRIRDRGGRILYVPAARFLHKGASSVERLGFELFLRNFHTNQIRYFAKHHGPDQARSVRRLALTGLWLRAAASFIWPLLPGVSRAGCIGIFSRVARRLPSPDEAFQ